MYSRIIDEVIQSSQVNFEEDGVEQQTLNEMRTVGLPSPALADRKTGLLNILITCPGLSDLLFLSPKSLFGAVMLL